MIEKQVLLDAAPNVVGASVYVDHAGCPAGVDHKKRLWVYRTGKGIGGFCHHCGEKGWVHTTSRGNSLTVAKAPELKQSKWPTLIRTYEIDWPAEARGWLRKYGITEFEANDNGVAYLPDEKRLMLPTVNYQGAITGWQERAIYPHQTPKYITRVLGNVSPSAQGHWVRSPAKSKGVVLVEDIVSAIKLSSEMDAVAMLGTKLRPEVRNIIAENYEEAYVWLDPDEAGFTATRSVCKELELFLETTHITSDVQPKEATDIEIRAHLGGHKST